MIRNIRLQGFFIFCFSCVFLCRPTYAQQANEPRIYLKSETITSVANAHAYLDNISAQSPSAEPRLVLIQFNKLPTAAQQAALKQSGITLIDYVPDNTYTALVQRNVNAEQVMATPVHSIIDVKPEWKSSNYVWNTVRGKKGAVEVLVSFMPGLDAASIQQFVASMGGRIDHAPMEKYGAYKVIIAAPSMRSFAQWYGVRYISPVSDIVPLDLESRPCVKSNVAAALPSLGGYGLLGDSVTVGVGDEGSGIYHVDLKDRVTNFSPAPLGNHGEHVNGIIGGAAIVDPLGASIAPHVSLVDFSYDLILPDIATMYHDYNMTITNNSYEVIAADCDYAGTYDVYSQLLDTLSIQNPYVANVFASGNDGWQTCAPYMPGFGTVGGGYQPAKNNIVVGSMTDFYQPASDESRGPVKDGRLKPEIIGVGLVVYSTVGVDQYEWAAGTSMASPQVAGVLALLTQRYKQLNGGAQPRADLLKAVLLNGTMDLGNPGPDYTYGFGAADAYRSLQMIDNGNYTSNNISSGDSQSFTITVPANTGQLKVMLCWHDVPAGAYAAKELVNDLDLTVKDPAAAQHLPLVLDPAPMNVNNNATEQPDHTNNVEQVTINNPAPGTYTIKVKGYNVPFGPQRYVVAYDMKPKALHLTFPLGGEQLNNGTSAVDSIRVFWDAVTDTNTFTVQISSDNGGSWSTLSNSVPADFRHLSFFPTGLSTGNMRVRVSRNNTSEVQTSQRFVINSPPVVGLDTAQCPGYINIHWSPVLNASQYYLLRKIGYYMQVVDSTTDTTYSFRDMSLSTSTYVAVQPVLNGLPGYRSLALSTIANTGNCTRPVSWGDVMIEKLVSANTGRMYTSTDFASGAPVRVRVRTLYDSTCTNYTLSYQVNGGSWTTLTDPGTIPSNGTTDIQIANPSLAPGSYNVRVAISNLGITDPNKTNDTLSFVLTELRNDTLNLATPFFDGFETMPVATVAVDSMGVSPNGHWDYTHANGFGRMRSFVDDDVTITGTRSISLDQNQNFSPADQNTFIGTFNFGGADTATTEVRMDFDYLLHGRPKSAAGNIVSTRAVDTSSWRPLFAYDLSAYPGFVRHVQSLSLTDAYRQSHRNFSTASQVSFGQSDTSLIATTNYGNGITIDNFRLYTVANDAAIVSVVSPQPSSCGLSSPQPLIVQVHNGVNYTLHNIQMYYSLDGGPTQTGVIDSIPAKGTINYTFPTEVSVAMGNTHSLNVWLSEAGDTYHANDTILNYNFRNNQIISSYPYLENFESGDGGYYSAGFRNSWQYGTPASSKINKAASGTKAWKTNLTGNYNNLELSYLYSPCFDISSLSNPMLSFSTAMDIENCGNTLCDAGYIEVSFDGTTWVKLGATGSGTNWYDSTFDVWNREGFTRWHVASIPLPQPGPGQVIHLRFVLAADPGATFEGIAVDDIHIFDLVHPIFPTETTSSVIQQVSGNQWTDVTLSNKVLASLQPQGISVNPDVTQYAHDTIFNPGRTQYTFPRSYTIATPQGTTDSVGVRLYLTDSEVVAVYNDTTCPSCSHIADAYSLGVTQYLNSLNAAAENGTLADDTGGVFIFHPYKSVRWVPYDNGYYAELYTRPQSEFWFNDGGPTGNLPAGTDYLNFMAYAHGQYATLYWYSLIDTAVYVYVPQVSFDSINFTDVKDTLATRLPVGVYSFTDTNNVANAGTLFYRLKWIMAYSGNVYYSPIRRVDFNDTASALITFSAKMINHRNVQLNWLSYLDGVVDHYKLERAIGDGSFSAITNMQAAHHYGQQYTYFDQPSSGIPTGTYIHYRLTAVLGDGSQVVLPERTLEWINPSTIVDVYPNPTYDGSVNISWLADAGTPMHITITDAVGRHIYSTTVYAGQWSNITTVQTVELPRGIYFFRLDVDGRKYVRKIVYMH